MKVDKIKVVVVEPRKAPYVKEIENELTALQEIVSGYIEVVHLGSGLMMIVNEEGKLQGLEPNVFFPNDYIAGTFFVCSSNGEDFSSVPDYQVNKVLKAFSNKIVEVGEF